MLTIHMPHVSRVTFVHYMACHEFMRFIPNLSQSRLVPVVAVIRTSLSELARRLTGLAWLI